MLLNPIHLAKSPSPPRNSCTLDITVQWPSTHEQCNINFYKPESATSGGHDADPFDTLFLYLRLHNNDLSIYVHSENLMILER